MIEKNKVIKQIEETKYTIRCDVCNKTIVENIDSAYGFSADTTISIKYPGQGQQKYQYDIKELHTPNEFVLCENCRSNFIDKLIKNLKDIGFVENKRR